MKLKESKRTVRVVFNGNEKLYDLVKKYILLKKDGLNSLSKIYK